MTKTHSGKKVSCDNSDQYEITQAKDNQNDTHKAQQGENVIPAPWPLFA